MIYLPFPHRFFSFLLALLGVWTLIFGALIGVEKFTVRKLFGVLASLTGVFLISRVDLSGSNDENRGSFPHKSTGEIALGDTMAAFSAILYGIYTIVMKKRVGSESRVNMPLFFGLVGLINSFILWPGFVILHLTGLETFSFPDRNRVWMIVLVCVARFLLFRLLVFPSHAEVSIFALPTVPRFAE